jgi:glutamate formiminotransferase/glutamate formiminotransferase/formiminotetrahydrofolate cyclodeaminase
VNLLSIPNVSEGADLNVLEAVAAAFAVAPARVLDVHADPDHNRSVYTLAGEPNALLDAVISGARVALQRIDLQAHAGLHPHVGVLDVAPVVHLDPADRGAACAAALVLGDRLGDELGVPVLLYGELAGGRSRAELRRGGPAALAERIAAGELRPDFGPRSVDPGVGVTLVTARAPLIAFNVELAPPATLQQARAIAAAIARHAPVAGCELVGLAPRAAFENFPAELPVRHLRLLEDVM